MAQWSTVQQYSGFDSRCVQYFYYLINNSVRFKVLMESSRLSPEESFRTPTGVIIIRVKYSWGLLVDSLWTPEDSWGLLMNSLPAPENCLQAPYWLLILLTGSWGVLRSPSGSVGQCNILHKLCLKVLHHPAIRLIKLHMCHMNVMNAFLLQLGGKI